MKTEEQDVKNETYKDARLTFIIFAVILFAIIVISVILYTTNYIDHRNQIQQLPLIYSIPTLTVFLPIITSVSSFIIYIKFLDNAKKLINYTNNDDSIFYITLEELRNPNDKFFRRRKLTLVTLIIFTIVSLLASQIYIAIIITIMF